MNPRQRRFRLNDIRTRTKLALGFAAILLLMLVLGALSTAQLRSSNRITEDINANWLPTVRGTLQLRSLMNEFRTQEFEHILAADEPERKPHEARMNALEGEFDKLSAASAGLPAAAEQQAIWARLASSWHEYLGENKKIRALAQADQTDSARALIRGKSLKLFTAATADLDTLAAHGVARSDQATDRSRSGYTQALTIIGVAIAAALLFGFGLAWAMGRSIAMPLVNAVAVATRIAKGDLRVSFDAERRDEIGDLYAALRSMVAGLSGVVVGVRSGVQTIAMASGEIAAGTQDLSDRTERQSGELQETSSTLDRLTLAAADNARVAAEASTLVAGARSVAANSAQIVDEVVARMGDISQSSRRISDITGVIDGIAFQTNILALNAAVEAARAGEQGRGFAVVASEVRTLAQRSAQAAKEIRGLISDSVEKVDAGSARVHDAGRTMHEIAASVERLSGLINIISTASSGQRDDIAGMNRSVSSLDTSTQQTAAMVEQSAAASASLKEQAGRLTDAVAVFQV